MVVVSDKPTFGDLMDCPVDIDRRMLVLPSPEPVRRYTILTPAHDTFEFHRVGIIL